MQRISTHPRECWYVPGSTTIISTIMADGRAAFSHDTPEQITERHPDAVRMPLDDAVDAIGAANTARFGGPPEPITHDGYSEMLNCLPPEGWTRDGTDSGFRMSEYTSGSWTLHLAIITTPTGRRCFQATRHATAISVEDFIRECRALV